MEDYESHVRMFARGVRGIALPETLFSYRKRPGSMSKAFDPHGVAYLYRRVWRNSPELLRRYGAELVGIYAENGHGALAPSACEPSPHHAALFRRDIPGLEEVAERLEACASRERLGRALRARCDGGGVEWDYTTARLLMALDREPAFARALLRSTLRMAPRNGWFRLYAMLAELRDGRICAAEALWNEDLERFCRDEAGAVGWILALEAVRGFPHVAHAAGAWLKSRTGVAVAPAPRHLGADAPASVGEFAELHIALEALRAGLGQDGGRGDDALREGVRIAAVQHVSPEAQDALIGRWERTWRSVARSRASHTPASTFWGRTADAYLEPTLARTPAPSSLEAADRTRWAELERAGPGRPAAAIVWTVARRLRQGALVAAE